MAHSTSHRRQIKEREDKVEWQLAGKLKYSQVTSQCHSVYCILTGMKLNQGRRSKKRVINDLHKETATIPGFTSGQNYTNWRSIEHDTDLLQKVVTIIKNRKLITMLSI
jgi:hypothetical protein